MKLLQNVPFGHKVCIRDTPADADVLKYGQVIGWDLHNRDVGPGIVPDNLAGHFTFIREHDFDVGGAFDHVIIGQHVSGGIHYHARSQTVFPSLARNAKLPHEFFAKKSF